jgi:hypothetical protein
LLPCEGDIPTARLFQALKARYLSDHRWCEICKRDKKWVKSTNVIHHPCPITDYDMVRLDTFVAVCPSHYTEHRLERKKALNDRLSIDDL